MLIKKLLKKLIYRPKNPKKPAKNLKNTYFFNFIYTYILIDIKNFAQKSKKGMYNLYILWYNLYANYYYVYKILL